MTDILPRLMPLRRIGIEADFYLVDCRSLFQQNVLAALGIEPAPTDSAALPTASRSRAATCAFAADTNLPARSGPRRWPRAWVWTGQCGLRVGYFISRRKTGTRTLANEAQLEKLLHANRFETATSWNNIRWQSRRD